MKIISLAAIKGGTGKSTMSVLLARILAASKHKVLLIDLDVNNSASIALLPDNHRELDPVGNKNIAAALLSTENDIEQRILPSCYPGIDLLRSHLQLTRVNPTQFLLRNKLRASSLPDTYDYVIVDTPGAYYGIHLMAFNVSDLIVTPVNMCMFDLSPLEQLRVNLDEDIGGSDNWHLFLNRMRPDNASQEDYVSIFQKKFPGKIYKSKIPDTLKVRDSIDRKMAIGRSKNYSKFREALISLASEITDEELAIEGAF